MYFREKKGKNTEDEKRDKSSKTQAQTDLLLLSKTLFLLLPSTLFLRSQLLPGKSADQLLL